MEVDTNESDKFADIGDFENSLAVSTPASIYFDEPSVDSRSAFIQVLQWIRNGNNARAKEIRVQAAFYFFSGGSKLSNKSQVRLAREVGVKKATISQKAVEFQDYFAKKTGLKDTMERVSVATGMRSSESRQKFSDVCKSNHQKRKTSLSSGNSPTTSTLNTEKRSSLREKVLEAAKLPLLPQHNADRS